MNDKELADKVVALGVYYRRTPDKPNGDPVYVKSEYWWDGLSARAFVRDWRVAGALMEKACHNKLMQVEQWEDSTEWAVDFGGHACADNESLPLAIIQACVWAMESVPRRLTQETK